MKRVLFLFALVLSAVFVVSIGASNSSSQGADASKIVIAYSSNVLGYTEPCG